MQNIGIIYNPNSAATEQAAYDLEAWLKDQGCSTWRGTSQTGREQPDAIRACELLIALGGDGTVLRTAHLAIPHHIPILGVAMGHLSFMAEVSPAEVRDGLRLLLNGDGWFDERTLVQAQLWRGDEMIAEETALNEVVLSRTDLTRVVEVDVAIDGMSLTTYHADGVLAATATGSTAYALAAGGPVLDPRSRSLLLVTIAGHLTTLPALVLPPETTITWTLRSWYPAAFSADGQTSYPLEQGDRIEVCRSPLTCQFARIHPRAYFYETLTERLRR